jgi:hypothetical protein
MYVDVLNSAISHKSLQTFSQLPYFVRGGADTSLA